MKLGMWISVPCCAAVLLLSGCESKVDVVGHVKYKGRPVTVGSVSLIAVDNINYVGEIGPDGTFKVPQVPAGPVKIGVTSTVAAPPPPGGRGSGNSRGRGAAKSDTPPPPPPPENPNPVPDNYSDPNTSGLTGTAGKEPIEIEING